MRFGRIWGTIFGVFWAILAGFWGFQRHPILKPKLEAEKVVLKTREDLREVGQAALKLIVDQPNIDNMIVDQAIIENIDRRSLKNPSSLGIDIVELASLGKQPRPLRASQARARWRILLVVVVVVLVVVVSALAGTG